jgi:hypothetical protein
VIAMNWSHNFLNLGILPSDTLKYGWMETTLSWVGITTFYAEAECSS